MGVKVNKEEFYLAIDSIFSNLNSNKLLVEYVKDKLAERNVLGTEIQAIMNRNISVKTVDLTLLYHMLNNIYDYMQKFGKEDEIIIDIPIEKLNPKVYFTDIEIKEALHYKREIKKSGKFPIIFENAIKLAEDQYAVSVPIQFIAELYKNNLIYYNTQTQRNTKIKEWKNSVVEVINVNNNAVAKIQKNMGNLTFISNFITFNLLQNGEDELDYKNGDLIIYSGEIDIIDGFHRSLSILNVLQENSRLQMNMGIMITNFDIEKARRFIAQEDKKTPIDKKYISTFDSERFSNMIVTKLNENSTSELRGKITTNEDVIKRDKALVLFSTLSDAIEYNFNLKNKKDVLEIAKWLPECFTTLMGLYEKEFISNIADTKKQSVINHKNMFIGYIAMFSKLRNSIDWEDRMFNLMENINFNKDNPEWNEIGIFTKNINKATIKKISKYFIDRL